MIIKHKNLEEDKITLLPEDPDDFWALRQVLECGDLVKSLTFRSPENTSDKIRPESRSKEPVVLTIEIDSVEYQDFSGRLRVSGLVVGGKEDYIGRHHTINLEENKKITITKDQWKKDQVERLEEATAHSEMPEIAILSIEEGEAVVAVMRRHGIGKTSTIRSGSGKKMNEEKNRRREFFGEVYKTVERMIESEDIEKIILAGPGFTKHDMEEFMEEKSDVIENMLYIEDTSSGGITGVQEAVRRGAVERVWKDARITRESRLVEELLERIAKGNKATYGMNQCLRAVELGAVEKLLVTDKILRKKREKGIEDIEKLIEESRQKGGEVMVLSSEFEPGQKIDSLGGIAALLRFNVNSQ